MLDIQLIHCLSKINLISLFIKQTLHLISPAIKKELFIVQFLCAEILVATYNQGTKPFPVDVNFTVECTG